MDKRFLACMDIILRMEGGFNQIAADTGGRTIFGIAYNHNKNLAVWAVIDRELTPDEKTKNIYGGSATSKRITAIVRNRADLMNEIQQTYYNNYWIASRAYTFNAPIDLLLFDSFFNMGVTAKKILQRWAGVKDDGIIGKQTTAAVAACKRPVTDLLQLRWDYYKTRPTFGTFGTGWGNRLKDIAAAIGEKWAPK